METNEAIMARIFELQNNREYEASYAYYHENWFTHSAPPGMQRHIEGDRFFWSEMDKGIPDRNIELKLCVDNGENLLAGYWVLTGTHTGVCFGHSPTGKSVKIPGLFIARFDNGKFVEHWGGPQDDIMMSLFKKLSP